MGYYRLKHSFTAGELSPLMNDRVDFERYKNGCKVLKNMFCATQGPAIRRSGFKFVYDLTSIGLDLNDPKVRTIPFIFNELRAYVMVFYQHTSGPRVIWATTNTDGTDGVVLGTGVACTYENEITLPYTGPSTSYTIHYAPDTAFQGAVIERYDASSGSTSTLTPTTHYTLSEDDITGELVVSLTAAAPATDAGDTLTFTVTTLGDVIGTTEVVTLALPTDWDIEGFDWAQSADEMYFSQSGLPPHIIRRHAHDCWELVRVTFANQPDEWSDTYGWPERVTFHQQRLVFAANVLRRQTVWMSQAGDFNNFGAEASPLASDAVTFTLDSGTQNKIQWLASGKSLHIGTMGNEWTVTGNDQSALTPSNILAQRQTNNGSEPNKPLLVGLTTLFVERHGRTVNEFVYDYTFDSYKTSDMAILSPHVTENYSIVDWAYQQTPDSIIWCVRADGALLGITYQRQHKVVGWHTHETQGSFRAIAAIPGNTREDDIWTVVERTINGSTKFYIEKLEDWFKSDSPKDGRFLDSHAVYDDLPTDSISGLTHLANETVGVLADGTVHPPTAVSAGGVLQLNREYSTVVVGLPFVSELRPHLADIDAERTGSSRGRTQRITNVTIDLYKSLGMWVGRVDQEDGIFEEEIPFRIPTDHMDQAVPLFTGWYTIAFPEGYDEESEYIIRQKQPLPLTVRGVTDEIEVYD